MTTTATIIIDFLRFLFFIISPNFDYAYVPEYNATNADFGLASPLKGIIATVVNIIANDKIIDKNFFVFIISFSIHFPSSDESTHKHQNYYTLIAYK